MEGRLRKRAKNNVAEKIYISVNAQVERHTLNKCSCMWPRYPMVQLKLLKKHSIPIDVGEGNKPKKNGLTQVPPWTWNTCGYHQIKKTIDSLRKSTTVPRSTYQDTPGILAWGALLWDHQPSWLICCSTWNRSLCAPARQGTSGRLHNVRVPNGQPWQ